MHHFTPGQRWISDTELQMGLGTVLSVEPRTVTLLFLATEEVRTYARQTAPLSRAAFAPGDRVQSHEGWSLEVHSVIERDGLLTYRGRRENGDEAELPEGELDNLMQLNRPADRLFTGQIDPDRWFVLRQRTRDKAAELASSDLHGLTGARTSLIPHQLYIAHEIADRYAPRVLLADEVGLGKTIEAGLILHYQLLSERARRVLIVVPENLQHQWLVEMRRRFNLRFSLFDEGRCRAAEESENGVNPFQTEQLVLCDLSFLAEQPTRFEQALEADWDLLVVDEAHHLQWSPNAVSREYRCIEQLAKRTTGALLLTATPEQLGKEGHFARLRLLDPDRFPDFDRFVAEEQDYEPIAAAVGELLAGTPLSEVAEATLRGTVNEGDNQPLLDALTSGDIGTSGSAREELVEHLLDRHGTGRVLFRNTRAAVKGFPARQLHAIPLPLPEAYAETFSAVQTTGSRETPLLLCPERLYQSEGAATPWTRIDPRVQWLIATLKQLRSEKVVVITATMETAGDLAEALRITAGIQAALFHEGMSLLERDRSAAFFADREYGSPILICSEIGSEGRNLQFAHHLVLFDLPLNPDLLEQRIGRLDRIGQSETIHIHVPYLEETPQSVLFHWYHEGLGAFEHTCPTGHSVFVQVEPALQEALHNVDADTESLPALIAATRQLNERLLDTLHRGRDRLLEYSSCRPQRAEALTRRARTDAAASEAELLNYLEELFDAFGVELEEHSENAFIIRPGAQMQEPFPGLPEDGLTFTCHRATALANEDMEFFTWEHPLVLRGMEMVLSSERGNTAITAVKHPKITPGTLLLEGIYLLESASSRAVQSGRYLPPSRIRVVVDPQRVDHASELSESSLNTNSTAVESETAREIVNAYRQPLRDLLRHSETAARRRIPELLEQAGHRIHQILDREIDRMHALRQVNPNVREEELHYLERQREAAEKAIASAVLRLDAQRVIVAT
ncbi:RNA polymerase-associated protein RapA [Thiohalomonas denitrificans]|uniref:RNA polymerase-associated protein RapA n=1 Tax=Thiohalomonas denitrificans TaxID=415747 RepID=A0A1G5QC84_9GAMM|nr:RNA polymerase-associated protein RapA [Thiohalomonas denitrificans]SCZ59248.1 ATP-dependent helicase HepA [Thiohalomonas denitrificans]